MKKKYLLGVVMLSFLTTETLSDDLEKPAAPAASNPSTPVPYKIDGWWKVSTRENVFLFKPERAFLKKTSTEEVSMTSDMRLEFIQDKGVFSTFNLPYEKFNGLKVKGYSEQCTYFTVSTVDAEDDGFTCKTEYEKLFSAILSNGKKVFVNRFEGVAINLETGKKMNVSNAVFRLKTSWSPVGGNLSRLEVIRDQAATDALLAKADKLAKSTEAIEAQRNAEYEAERIAKQSKNDKIKKDTLKELSSASKGSEDSCQNMDYWDGNLLVDEASISCQMSGAGITIKDLKSAGWIITSVSKAGEQRTLGGKSTQYLLTIKKVK